MDIKVINPSADEVKKLTAANLAPVEIDATKVFSKDVGVKTILGVPILFAYNVRADMPEEVVYKMLAKFYKERDSLAKADPGFDAHGARLHRHAGERHQRRAGISGACGAGEVPQGAQGLERQVEDRRQQVIAQLDGQG